MHTRGSIVSLAFFSSLPDAIYGISKLCVTTHRLSPKLQIVSEDNNNDNNDSSHMSNN